MDDAVRIALEKWPNVPSCSGWLRLTRRGEWRVPQGLIYHAGLNAFIGRNYAATNTGAWYFQNGPQQVFVSLDYTPYVLRLTAPERLETHTGLAVESVSEGWLDEEGSLTLICEHGAALLDDRDLAILCEHIKGDLESTDAALTLAWAGLTIPLGRIKQAEIPARFGFIREPT